MEEKKRKDEELQSRREFFKNAAKKALPFVAAIAMASNPIVAKAVEEAPMGCKSGCSGSCKGSCTGNCAYGCSKSCIGTCTNGCGGGCKGSCYGCTGY